MATLRLPQVGNGATATVRRWVKKAGDALAQGDVIMEVESEQGLVHVESPVAGKLRQALVEAGKSIAVGAALAEIQTETGAGDMNPPKPAISSAPTVGKVVPILMPKAGQSMEEGTIVKWHVKAGQQVTKGQVIFEVETDKATMDVEATDSGRLAKIVLPEGGVLPVLQPVAYLAESDADLEAFIAGGEGAIADQGAQTEATPQRPLTPALSPEYRGEGVEEAQRLAGGRVKASPAARKIASEKGVDLAAVSVGSGPGGRILSTDVQQCSVGAPGSRHPTPGTRSAGRRKISKMRRAIADNLLISKQTIPHFYIRTTINAEPMFAFYQAEKAKYPCSVNDLVVLACSRAIMEFPAFRSRIERDEIVELPDANIGIAVGMDEGLVVPVLMASQRMKLQQIGSESKRIANAAKSGKLEGVGNGVFTITNMGMFGVEEFAAIINPPEAAILAVGAIREQVIVKDGAMRPGKVMTMTLSADHRVIDGVLGAKFMARLKEMLENPAAIA